MRNLWANEEGPSELSNAAIQCLLQIEANPKSMKTLLRTWYYYQFSGETIDLLKF